MITPVLVPAVCDKPIRHARLCAEAHDLDRVASEHRVMEQLALIHTRLVGGEALVHKEHTSDGTLLVDFLHHGIGALAIHALLANTVAAGAMVLALKPIRSIVDARPFTFRRRGVAAAIWVLLRRGVVGARSKLIGVAHGLVTIISTVDDASVLVVRVDRRRNAAMATHITTLVARGDILS